MLPYVVLLTGQDPARRFVFVTWKGDHPPRHVHVYRDGSLVVRFNLEARIPMKGKATRRVMSLILELEREGLL